MRKRIVAGLLAVCMTLTLFTACEGKKKNEETKPEENKTSVTQASAEPTKEAVDLGMWADYKIDKTNNLSNPNASEKACVVYNWLNSIKGQYIITGLQEQCADTKNTEFLYIKKLVDDLPGLRGYDFINGDYEGVTRRAKTWDKQNMLVSICWHMGVPGNVDGGYNSSQGKVEGLSDILNNPDSPEYKQIIEDMDKAVPYLKELMDENVVVLWRPFHEFDGAWFWWGKAGKESFIKLWRIMYDRYTNHYGLNNLIWVLGYSNKYTKGHTEWYPGDEYVDIIGADTYAAAQAQKGYSNMYDQLATSFPDTKKPMTLHECGKLPNSGALQENKAEWLWFLIWHTNYVGNDAESGDGDIQINFTSDYMLTLSEMPDFDALIAAAG